MRRAKSKKFKLQNRLSEVKEIELLESWTNSGKPDTGFNPISLPALPEKSPIGRLRDGSFSRYSGAIKFSQLPLSKKTKDGLKGAGYSKMTDIQRASLPHSLCGRDILGAAKTGSGKTLAFIVPVLEKLYRARWGPEDGVGCIIMSPTRELAGQLFDVLTSVGKYHGFSAGLLIGGRKDVDTEKERVNKLNVLVCTPGRLLQHMDETPNFECSQLQVLVLDEADRILDVGFKKEVNAIVSQLPKYRQTLLFSATQTKSVQDLARLSLKDPEYISVHEESATATPSRLQQTAMIVPLDQKLDMLWSFIKAHLNSRILVFLSSCKQVKFVFEAFKKLRPGIPLKCLHGRMKQDKRMGIYTQFCEKRSVLFCTDVASRGLDFNKAVDWVVQADCPDDVASYIHRAGRTARYLSGGRSILFVTPSETKMLEKLKAQKIPIMCIKANSKKLQPVSGLMAALLVKYPNFQQLAQRAFITYLRSIHKQRDKEVFDVTKLPIDEYSASLGLPMTPKVRFLKQKMNDKKASEENALVLDGAVESPTHLQHASMVACSSKKEESNLEEDILLEKETLLVGEEYATNVGEAIPATGILKNKKMKINVHKPMGTKIVFDEEEDSTVGTRVVFDEEDNTFSAKMDVDSVELDKDKVKQRFAVLMERLKETDKEDKALEHQRRKEKRIKEKMKRKRSRDDVEQEEEGDMSEEDKFSNSDEEADTGWASKRTKIYSDSDNGSKEKIKDSITLQEQEELALKLLSSMHS